MKMNLKKKDRAQQVQGFSLLFGKKSMEFKEPVNEKLKPPVDDQKHDATEKKSISKSNSLEDSDVKKKQALKPEKPQIKTRVFKKTAQENNQKVIVQCTENIETHKNELENCFNPKTRKFHKKHAEATSATKSSSSNRVKETQTKS